MLDREKDGSWIQNGSFYMIESDRYIYTLLAFSSFKVLWCLETGSERRNEGED